MIPRYSLPDMELVWSDENKYHGWLKVELAVCEAWTQLGIIPAEDMILLKTAQLDLIRMDQIFQRTHHDMTAFTRSITEKLGPEGRWIHLGLTSSDVIDTAAALQIIDAINILEKDLDVLSIALKKSAIKYKDTPMMGRTHGIHAEPITFGLKLAIWQQEVVRHIQRLKDAKTGMNVGKISGVVGTYATVSPELEERVCFELGLQPAPISNQIIQRDRHAHLITTLALVAASLEKFATEIRHLQRTEVREVEEPFEEGQTGSSAMPHKRNPELSERVCGLARLIRGHSVTSLENVALWHERDISHSSAERVIIPDSFFALNYILNIFTGIIHGLRVYPERMWVNLESSRGLVFSQRTLLALIEKGLSREDAYKLVQTNAMLAWDHGFDFRELLLKDTTVGKNLTTEELNELFDYTYFTRHTDAIFNRLGWKTEG
jgi:adenylosuccinate lyase